MEDSSFNSSLDFFRAFPSETNMTISISNTHVSLESGSLSGFGLLLNWFNLDDFFSNFWFDFFFVQEMVNNLVLFDWDSESENSFKGINFSGFN